MKQKLIIIGLIFSLLSGFQVTELLAQTVNIDMSTEYQSISGFGSVNMPGWIDDLTEDLVDKAYGNEPGQMGLSILRIRVPNDTAQFYREVPTALLAKNHGAIIMGSPWSPPAELKSNNNTVGGYLLPENYDAYADHLLRFAQYMNTNGAPMHAISIQNEPDIEVNYESCDWSSRQMIDFLKDQGPKLDTLNIIAPESFQFRRPLSDSILNDSDAVQYVDIIGGHIYGGGLIDYSLARDKGKEVWMTEHLTGSGASSDNTWSLALDLATEINDCMKANFNTYIWWYLRRFYSPIDDGGNITKKGYVMTHFSKFIRPGAVRIAGTVATAPEVDVTAYKTDSSLVIIVVNQSAVDVNLDFSIQNGTIDTLTKFTTSATKNVLNEGGLSISAGNFSASVEAESISTFTSHAGNAARFGNILPVADAGTDIVVNDTDGNGSESILLDATSSADSDGMITNYSWSVNGIQVAWESTYELSADIGVHNAVLTVTDNDGATHSDTLNISVNSIYTTEIWLDAECANVGSTWEILSDADASNERYVAAPIDVESTDAPSTNTNDQIIFTFHISEAGPYKVWGRVITPNANDDSYWVSMDSNIEWAMWNSIPTGDDWHWDDVHDQSNGDQVMVYNLDTGYHSLSICFREDGALLDKVYLSNMGITPDGIGEVDIACSDITDLTTESLAEVSEIMLYPNPASKEIHISWGEGYTSLRLIGLDGKTVILKEYLISRQESHLDLSIDPGIYFLILGNENKSGVTKLIIE